jgi:hypothetical protein
VGKVRYSATIVEGKLRMRETSTLRYFCHLTVQFSAVAFGKEHCAVSKRSFETTGVLSAEYFRSV